MSTTIIILGTISLLVFAIIAELFGRAKHIGRLWSFLLLGSLVFPGILAIIFSPHHSKPPTSGKKHHLILSLLLLIVSIFLLPLAIFRIDPFGIGIGMSFLLTASYLYKVSQGRIINKNPKEYFEIHLNGFKLKWLELFRKNDVKYYLSNSENEQFGPISEDELTDHEINNNTLIWFDGLEDWIYAKDYGPTSKYITKKPPPLPKNVCVNENSSQISQSDVAPKPVKTKQRIKTNIVHSGDGPDTGRVAVLHIYFIIFYGCAVAFFIIAGAVSFDWGLGDSFDYSGYVGLGNYDYCPGCQAYRPIIITGAFVFFTGCFLTYVTLRFYIEILRKRMITTLGDNLGIHLIDFVYFLISPISLIFKSTSNVKRLFVVVIILILICLVLTLFSHLYYNLVWRAENILIDK